MTVEGCAAGGARVDYAMAARTDVVWPSDNTAPLDRLRIQYGFLSAHAPHLMSSWVTDAPGMFSASPRSLAFRFVLGLILMRKKLLKFTGRNVAEGDGGPEIWQLQGRGSSESEVPPAKFDVVNPNLSDDDVRELIDQLSEVLQSEL